MLIDIESFRFKLAKELGKSLAEIDDMSYNEFHSWFKYSQREKFTADRIEIMLAQLTAIIVNVEKRKVKDKNLTSALDFLISIDEDIKELIKEEEREKDLIDFMRGFKNGSR